MTLQQTGNCSSILAYLAVESVRMRYAYQEVYTDLILMHIDSDGLPIMATSFNKNINIIYTSLTTRSQSLQY